MFGEAGFRGEVKGKSTKETTKDNRVWLWAIKAPCFMQNGIVTVVNKRQKRKEGRRCK